MDAGDGAFNPGEALSGGGHLDAGGTSTVTLFFETEKLCN